MKLFLVWECYQSTNKPFKKYLTKIFLKGLDALEFSEQLQKPDEWRKIETRETE